MKILFGLVGLTLMATEAGARWETSRVVDDFSDEVGI